MATLTGGLDLKIVTHFHRDPPDDARFSWQAWLEASNGPTGYGASREAAIDDLLAHLPRSSSQLCTKQSKPMPALLHRCPT
jgi:hypothetical protein